MISTLDTQVLTPQILNPFLVAPEENRAPQPLRLMGHEVVAKATGQDTGGAFAVGLLKAEPMSGPPLHMHTREDEWFYVLSGVFTFQVGDKRFTAGPGTSLFAPRDVPHTWQNCTDQLATAVAMITPPDMEGFFVEAAQGNHGPAELQALLEQYGVQVLGPPLAR